MEMCHTGLERSFHVTGTRDARGWNKPRMPMVGRGTCGSAPTYRVGDRSVGGRSATSAIPALAVLLLVARRLRSIHFEFGAVTAFDGQ